MTFDSKYEEHLARVEGLARKVLGNSKEDFSEKDLFCEDVRLHLTPVTKKTRGMKKASICLRCLEKIEPYEGFSLTVNYSKDNKEEYAFHYSHFR